MKIRWQKITSWLYKRAENVMVLLLAIMFVSFIIQIAFRYLFNFPIGWTSEMTVITWLWLVLWGAAFVLREDEEIRFDLLYSATGKRARRMMTAMTALVLLVVYILSFPAVWDYVTFMKVQRTAYLKIRFDFLYSIYLFFAIAVIIRYVWILQNAIRRDMKDEVYSGSDPVE